MVDLMTERASSMVQLIKTYQFSAQTGFRVHLDRVDEDMDNLQMSQRESLLKTQDPYKFLLEHNSLLEIPELPEPRYTTHHWLPFKKFTMDVTQFPMCVTSLSVFNQSRASEVVYSEERKACMDSADLWTITWDPSTAHSNVLLGLTDKGEERAVFTSQPRGYPDHPDRFTHCVQVLSREALTGRCYFEICSSGGCFVGLTYKSIERKGNNNPSVLGLYDKSWACFGGGYMPLCTYSDTWLLIPKKFSNRVAVHLDHDQGILTFYSVLYDKLSILHKVETKFTEPLYFGALFLYQGDQVVIRSVEEME
ncbi:tripartite motif-containing protein 16-like [Periophthalmus magnuspinnatus]|uniref:tripartite motif-containing protein 16-like n=1 Tax=Periophthalmus magnuspinnatus TaxID=409849 RepID=UPI002436D066|nr:tripartite motif-containing protein 16-like [Periophthalmus magnuspinnatus]